MSDIMPAPSIPAHSANRFYVLASNAQVRITFCDVVPGGQEVACCAAMLSLSDAEELSALLEKVAAEHRAKLAKK